MNWQLRKSMASTLRQLQMTRAGAETQARIRRHCIQAFDDGLRLLTLQQLWIAGCIKQCRLQSIRHLSAVRDIGEHDDRFRPIAIAPINVRGIRRVSADRRIRHRTLVLMKDEIAQTVEYRLAAVDLHFLQRMRVMPDDDIGAGIDQRVTDFNLIIRQAILKARAPEWRHTPMQREHDQVGFSARGFNGNDGAFDIFDPGACMNVGRASGLFHAAGKIDVVRLRRMNRRDAGLVLCPRG